MSTLNPAEVIAEALGRHYAVSFGVCLCGWKTTRTQLGESWRPEFDEHQASVIAALPDIAVVSLPKPNTDGFEGFTTWDASDVHARVGSGKVRSYTEDPRMTSDEARQFAAELLAAANVADRVIQEKR